MAKFVFLIIFCFALNLEIKAEETFLMFGSKSCPWCEKQKQVLLDKDIEFQLKNYKVLYVDMQKEKELSKIYNVKSVPALFILDEDKEIIKKNSGYLDKNKFLEWLNN